MRLVLSLVLVDATPFVVFDGRFVAFLTNGETCRELTHPFGEAPTTSCGDGSCWLLNPTVAGRRVIPGLAGGGSTGLLQAEVGAVPAGCGGPLLPGFVDRPGDDVHGVGVPAAGECDVRGGRVGAVGQEAVGVVGGVSLDAVHGGRIRQVQVLPDVVGVDGGVLPTIRVLQLDGAVDAD